MTDGGVIDRRRVLLTTAALSLGWLAGHSGLDAADAAKRKRRRKDRKGKKKHRHKNKHKNKDRDKRRKKHKKRSKDQKSGGSGRQVVKEALKHKGDKYKWGGASPKGFDCSGFAWYVYDRAVNVDIGRSVKDQYRHGKSVKKGKWKDGDVLFFKNTFEKGLSHCGIYIGRGRMIHAENERTGVVISDVDSGYYEDHYAGARRML